MRMDAKRTIYIASLKLYGMRIERCKLCVVWRPSDNARDKIRTAYIVKWYGFSWINA